MWNAKYKLRWTDYSGLFIIVSEGLGIEKRSRVFDQWLTDIYQKLCFHEAAQFENV